MQLDVLLQQLARWVGVGTGASSEHSPHCGTVGQWEWDEWHEPKGIIWVTSPSLVPPHIEFLFSYLVYLYVSLYPYIWAPYTHTHTQSHRMYISIIM